MKHYNALIVGKYPLCHSAFRNHLDYRGHQKPSKVVRTAGASSGKSHQVNSGEDTIKQDELLLSIF